MPGPIKSTTGWAVTRIDSRGYGLMYWQFRTRRFLPHPSRKGVLYGQPPSHPGLPAGRALGPDGQAPRWCGRAGGPNWRRVL